MVNIKKPNLSFRNLRPLNKSRITRIVQHHMAHASWDIQDVHNFHKNTNGWSGIGYNYWIDFKGNIYEGRGMNQGAHASGYNSTSIGVGYQGDFTKQKMPDAQLQAGIELNKWLMQQLPNVSSTSRIVGHGSLPGASTACPGGNFRMSELRSGISGAPVQTAKTQPTKVKSAKTSNISGSIVDYLKANDIDSSFDNRKRLAKQYGISNYTGTASQNTELLNKLKGGGVQSTQKVGVNVTADGKWGNATTSALQDYLDTPVDGIISNQRRNSVSQSLYGNTVRFSNSGNSNVIVALQRKVGANADGLLGNETVRGLQRYLGTPVDGVLSRPSTAVKEMQRQLNARTF